MSDIPVETTDSSEPQEDIRIKLNRETSKIDWNELQKFYAKGAVIAVTQGVDLIDVGVQISNDNKSVVEQWLADGTISQIQDAQAQLWYDKNTTFWAVVIAPWVLVQELMVESTH